MLIHAGDDGGGDLLDDTDAIKGTMIDEEKLRLIVKEEAYKAITLSLSNGLGAKVREIARGEAEDLISIHSQMSDELDKQRWSAERWRFVAIMAVCSSVGGGGLATMAIKYMGVLK